MHRDEKGYRPTQEMFTEVPPKYDYLNRVLTLNMDEGWRRKTADRILSKNPEKVLDLCCGTADLTLHLARKSGGKTEIYGLDFSHTMLDRAKEKLNESGFEEVTLIQGDAGNMPFDDNSFDAVGISFGFRNLTYQNPDAALHVKEILRILRPGGRLIIVETSQPKNALVRSVNHLYHKAVTGPIGGLLTGNRPAYDYLASSAIHYFSPDEMKKFLLGAGFSKFEHQPLMMGAAAIYTATK